MAKDMCAPFCQTSYIRQSLVFLKQPTGRCTNYSTVGVEKTDLLLQQPT
ncbi:hypothetical protein [Paenibacillus polymyxa]|nr:hypothetical protein [Paenibacillus polymyxa]WCM63747.1 hypothetical protein OYT09_12810 [Paenibacillus polymyxa]